VVSLASATDEFKAKPLKACTGFREETGGHHSNSEGTEDVPLQAHVVIEMERCYRLLSIPFLYALNARSLAPLCSTMGIG